MPDYALEQCSVPEKADILRNDKGSAPGLLFHRDGRKLYALPGVPLEMEHLLDKYILPDLAPHGTRKIAHRILKTTGITESDLWQKIGSIESLGEEVTVASLPSHLGVRIRLSLCGEGDLSARLDTAERYIREKSGDCIYGVDEETLEEIVGGLLRTQNLTLAVAESCTGGLIGHRLTNVAGSSDYFLEGVVTYSNEAKRNRLGVGGELLSRHGAVSREVATAMAEGVRRLSGADIGLSVTGIAGPAGGSREKPVGLTYIALDAAAGAWCDEFLFPQDRVRNKERAAQAALNGLRRWLIKNVTDKLVALSLAILFYDSHKLCAVLKFCQ